MASVARRKASRYTLQDTPLFTCTNMRLVEALGGEPIAEPVEPTVRLKLHAAVGDGVDYASAVCDLFGLGDNLLLESGEVCEHV